MDGEGRRGREGRRTGGEGGKGRGGEGGDPLDKWSMWQVWMGVVGIATLVFDNVCGVIIVRITSCARGDTIYLRPLQVDNIRSYSPGGTSSRYIGYLRHQQQVDL